MTKGKGSQGLGWRTRRPQGRPCAGLTMLEIVVALAIMTVAMLGFARGLVSTTTLSSSNRESGLARQAIRKVIEDMQDGTFAEIFARYDADPGNDPDPPVTSPGPSFEVLGLTPRPDDPDGMVGEIVFPTDDTGALLEETEDRRLGTPRDLNGDGFVDGIDHAGDYRLLPVLVRVAWRGPGGNSLLEVATFLTDR